MRKLTFLIAMTALAQTPALKFEVAIVRPTAAFQPPIVDSAQVKLSFSMVNILQFAFNTRLNRLSAPAWTNSTNFEVQAKLPEGANERQVPQMLQSLLAERFKLAFHREIREETVYALKVDNNGLKLKEADSDPAVPERGGPKVNADGQRIFYAPKFGMDTLVEVLVGYVDFAPVSNETGLKGFYEITLPTVNRRGRGSAAPPADQASDPDGETSIFAALKKMGLVLEKRKGPVEYIIVDHLEKTPADN